MKAITKKGALDLFEKIDKELSREKRAIRVTLLGGLAVVLNHFRERSTMDVDIAPTKDMEVFVKVCQKLKIPVDVITVTSTVDLNNVETANHFSGVHLIVDSILGRDLIKLKLERFLKQDPEDIFAIIDKMGLSYTDFRTLVKEMMVDFVGDSRNILLSALEVVERKYTGDLKVFEKEFGV